MSEENPDVNEATQVEEVVAPQQSSEQTEDSHAQGHEPEESDKDYNFRQLRESKKQVERELLELREMVNHLASGKSNAPAQETDDWEVGDEDLVEGKHVKKLYSKIERMLSERDAVTTEDRLRSKFPDIEQVVSRENLEKLKKTEPEIYASIISSSDPYARGVSAYKTLKAMKIYTGDDPSHMDKEKAAKNHARPMSTQAIKGHGAIHEANAFANGLTPELKKQLLKEMVEASKAR